MGWAGIYRPDYNVPWFYVDIDKNFANETFIIDDFKTLDNIGSVLWDSKYDMCKIILSTQNFRLNTTENAMYEVLKLDFANGVLPELIQV